MEISTILLYNVLSMGRSAATTEKGRYIMRQIKRLALALCALAMALALAGCGGSMTPEKLVEEMANASKEKTMTQMTMDLALDASMGAEGVTMDISVGMGTDVMMALDPYAMYMDVVLDMSMLGEEISESMEIYMLEEDGEAVSYTYMDSAGQWTRQAAEVDMDAMTASGQGASYDWLLDKTGNDLALAEEKPQVNGRETYMLTAILGWDDMMKAMEAMDSAALEEALGGAELEDLLAEAGLGDLNLSVLNFTTVYYIDAETYLPLKMEMDVLGLDVLLSDIMKAAMAGLSPEEQVEMDIAVNQFRAVLDNISYDPASIPALPPEAADAVDMGDLAG